MCWFVVSDYAALTVHTVEGHAYINEGAYEKQVPFRIVY